MDKQTADDLRAQDILIYISNLRDACYSLNCEGFEVTVMATGSMWATLKLTFEMRKVLTNNKIHWQFDL